MSAQHLVRTKLYPPALLTDVVPRKRLDAALDQLSALRLFMIQAPAGYGKTTLISNWLHQQNKAFAWYSLGESDNNGTRFLQYLLAALEPFLPELASLQEELKHDILDAEAVLTSLINNLTNLEQELILVLDDYHLISKQEVHALIQFFLEHMPRHLHMVMTSRNTIPLALAKFRVRRQVLEVTAHDLRFTQNEVELFLNSLMGLNLTSQELAVLEQRTEGWVASLQLAALSLQAGADNSRFLNTFQDSDPFVFEYLADEVFEQQSQEVQTFLLETSILERFNQELCKNLTSLEDAADVLEAILEAKLFIIPLDTQQVWFRYHHLFADFLQTKLKKERAENLADLHTRASNWFEKQALLDEAIHHAIAGNDIERAVKLVETHSQQVMWQRDDRPTLRNWLTNLPEEVVRASPRLSLDNAWLLASSSESERWIEDAERALQHSGQKADALQGEALVLWAERSIAKGEVEQALEQLNQALELLKDSYLCGMAEQTKGYLLRVTGEVTAAEQTLRKAAERCKEAQNLIGELASLCDLAEVLKLQGRLNEAKQIFETCLQLAQQGRKQPAHTGSAALVGLADVLREQNDLEAALRYAKEGLELGQKISYLSIEVYAHEVLARIYLAKGEVDSTRRHLDSILLRSNTLQSRRRRAHIEAHCSSLWLALGELNKAKKWIEDYPFQLKRGARQERDYIGLCRILLAQDKPAEALKTLDELYLQSKQAKRFGRTTEVLILKARALQILDRQEKALEVLEEALALGEPEGYVRLFADEGEGFKRLLQQAISTSRHTKYLGKLLKSFSQLLEQGLTQTLLTKREVQILELIAQGLSNEAIAEKLIRSVGTIKTHSSNIYSKLGVTSRTEAVARARELTLLDV